MKPDTWSISMAEKLPISGWRLWWRRFFIRLRSWEYWPIYIFNLPVLGIWIWNAIKARDFFFFTLTNPGIETGGFFGESKSAILYHLPEAYKPKTILLKAGSPTDTLASFISSAGLTYPLIAKPEVGERGWLISKVHGQEELEQYVADHRIDTILQEYVGLPLEVSIMVYAMPDGGASGVSSVCEKHFLQVNGDGRHTIGELILMQDRAVLQLEKLWDRFGDRWDEILPAGETLILEHVGNHCRGTMFLDRRDQIDEALTNIMVKLLKTMPGVFYGRFDMRVGSWASLKDGKDIRVLEFNGASSDPTHIYQPGYSLLRAYRDIAWHWHVMYKIARYNRRLGHPPVTFNKIISALIIYFRYKRTN